MSVLTVLVSLLAAMYSLIALIKPVRPYRSRKQALLGLWGFLILMGAAAGTTPKPQENAAAPVANQVTSASATKATPAPLVPPEKREEVLRAYCRYREAYPAAIRRVDAKWGTTPADSLQVDEAIITEEGAVIGPNLRSGLNDLYRIPAGQHLIVRERIPHPAGAGRFIYRVMWREKQAEGYVDATSLKWLLDDSDLVLQHARKMKTALEAEMEVIESQQFGGLGVPAANIHMAALKEDWESACKRR